MRGVEGKYDLAAERNVPSDIRDAYNISLGIRQSQLRRITGTIAYHLASIFGFQLQHEHGKHGEVVLASVANQVEHVVALLANRMDTYPELTFSEALRASVRSPLDPISSSFSRSPTSPRHPPPPPIHLRAAQVASLHQKVFANFINWVNHVGLPSRVMQRGYISLGSYDVSIWEFQCSEEANAWLCNAQLNRLMLFFLMHGEAANLRHLPECLCFLFYGMANTLLLNDTTGFLEPSEIDFPPVANFAAASSLLDAPGYPEMDFLTSIVTPMYEFIKNEVLTRKDEDVHTRAMYDDITECFWQRPQIARMLPAAYGRHMDRGKGGQDLEAVALKAYAHFRELLKKASKQDGGAKNGLREFFGKTYFEKQGWAHCYHVFGRIFMWHSVAFHLCFAYAFTPRGLEECWEGSCPESRHSLWSSLSTVCITHAFFKIVRQLVDAHIGHPPRSAFSRVPGFRGTDKQSRTEHMVIIAGFAVMPLLYVLEETFRPDLNKKSARIYAIVSAAYCGLFLGSAFVHTKPGHRVRSLWRKKHLQHIGNDTQLAVPLQTWLTYTIFWCAILTVKLLFGYFQLVLPLKKPLQGLIVHPFARIEVEHCELNFQLKNGPLADVDDWILKNGLQDWHRNCFCGPEITGWCLNRNSAYELVMRCLIIVLRCTVPWLVFQFDTYIWFNLGSAICSSMLAVRRKIGVISHWKHLVKRYPEAVHHFNVKLLGTNNGDSLAAAAAAAASGAADWSVEARSAEWQCWARAWNEIMASLRFTDVLSNVERDELVFSFISGADCEDFFGTSEYAADLPQRPPPTHTLTTTSTALFPVFHRYVLFPTMLTSPVFTATVWQQGKRAYPSFERTLMQTRDLMVWLCVKLGLIEMESRHELMQVFTGLAGLHARMVKSKRSGAAEVLRMRSSVVALVEHLQAVQRAPLPLVGSSTEAELAEGIADQVHLLMQRVKGLFVDGVDKDTLAIPLDGVTRECADMWRRLQDLVKPETLLESAASSALRNLHDEAAEAVLGALGRSMTTSNPGGEPQNLEAKRQILFFANSLFNTTMVKPPPVSRMKSWSCFTPHYAEDVTYSMAQLKGATGDNVNLQNLLVSLFPDEWENFCERIGVLTMVAELPKSGQKALQRWASDRAQVLSRTVRGMMRYADGLRVLARLEGVPEEEIEMVVSSKFEYVVTCQIYGKLASAKPGSDDKWKGDGIDELRRQFARNMRVAYVDTQADGQVFSCLLGIDPISGADRTLFKVKLPGNPILGEGKPENQNQAIIFTRGEHLQTLDMNQDNYLGESYKMRNLLEYFYGRVRIVGFREHIFSESGGAVAHFAASNEFVFGTMVQRFLTWPLCVRFHYGHPDVWDKTWAFSSGGVSKASRTLHVSEDIFAGFNTVLRGGGVEYLEYIHCGKGRDMGFTAINGFEQKISAGNALQCTSRDLYRLGKYFDIFRLLSFYCSGSGFYMTTMFTIWAVYWFAVAQLVIALAGAEVFSFEWYDYERPDLVGSSGSAGEDDEEGEGRMLLQLGSAVLNGTGAALRRRLQGAQLDLSGGLDASVAIDGTVSPGFATVSPYSPHEFALSEVGKYDTNGSSTNVVGEGNGLIYGSFVTVQLGFTLMIPFAMEVLIERGPREAVVKLFTTFFGLSWVFSLFAMQTKGWNFSNAITYGRASYVATGRGYQVETVSVPELYSKYAQSHIYLAAEMVFYLLIFQSITAVTDTTQIALMVWAAYLAAAALALSPWIFNPQALTYPAVSNGMRQWAKWMADIGEFKMAGGNYTKWHAARLKLVREASGTTRCIVGLVYILMPKLVLVLACFAYVRGSGGSTARAAKRPMEWHFALIAGSVALLLALSFVNMFLHSLVARVDRLDGWLEGLKEKLPAWMRPKADRVVDAAESKKGGGSPYTANETSVWDVITSVVGVLRRVLSFALNYTRFTLIFVWYFVIVWGWEQLCWVNSCSADEHTPCHIKMSTFAWGLPTWWFFAIYAWGKPNNFGEFMTYFEDNKPITAVHDLLLSCDQQASHRAGSRWQDACSRSCITFDNDFFACYRTEDVCNCVGEFQDASVRACNLTRGAEDNPSFSEFEKCVQSGTIEYTVRGRTEDYDECWSDLPEMYIMFVLALTMLTVCVQWAGMVRDPKKDARFQPKSLMRVARVWSDHYYKLADRIVGLALIFALWILTILPLNYVQSVLLFKRNFYRVIERRTHKADLLEKLIH